MFIFYAFFLAYITQTIHSNVPTPIISSKTNIDSKKT